MFNKIRVICSKNRCKRNTRPTIGNKNIRLSTNYTSLIGTRKLNENKFLLIIRLSEQAFILT